MRSSTPDLFITKLKVIPYVISYCTLSPSVNTVKTVSEQGENANLAADLGCNVSETRKPIERVLIILKRKVSAVKVVLHPLHNNDILLFIYSWVFPHNMYIASGDMKDEFGNWTLIQNYLEPSEVMGYIDTGRKQRDKYLTTSQVLKLHWSTKIYHQFKSLSIASKSFFCFYDSCKSAIINAFSSIFFIKASIRPFQQLSPGVWRSFCLLKCL